MLKITIGLYTVVLSMRESIKLTTGWMIWMVCNLS